MKSIFSLIKPAPAPQPLRALTLALLLAGTPALAAEPEAATETPPAAQAPATTSIQSADEGGFMAPVKKAFGSVSDSVTHLFSFGEDDAAEKPAAETAPAQPIPIDQPHPVGDLAYGDLLFEYYQQRYFAAITKILVAQQRGLLSRDAEHTQILLGALYISYGMLDKGEAIFRQLLAG
ncbi:MAG TPA: hypothetical protein VFX11_02515, partial [Candidatus Kapabacteria bacterium]|nr:hypothetical protein [Candidatus Kapabacteria bacterium]